MLTHKEVSGEAVKD